MANPAFKNNIISFDTFTTPAFEGVLWIANVLGLLDETNAHASQVSLGASKVDITCMLCKRTGANAITVGVIQADAHHPSDPRMIVQDITITENIFTDMAYTFQSCVPIFVAYLTGAKITHNDTYDVPYSGICYGYGWGANDQGGSDEYEKRGRLPVPAQI